MTICCRRNGKLAYTEVNQGDMMDVLMRNEIRCIPMCFLTNHHFPTFLPRRYICKHVPIFLHKTEGPPCSTTGCFLPITAQYRDLLPAKAQNVLDREQKHYETKNKAEDYLAFSKYYCPETDMFLFFHPVKSQWKVINSENMHLKHIVKAFSEGPTRVVFPPLVDFQGHYETKGQYPGAESQELDSALQKRGVIPFVDKDFPPSDVSILGKHALESAPKVTPKELKGGVSWYRAREIHDGDFPVRLFDKIAPSHVLQGGLGDCWLIAAISVVAEFPDFFPKYVFQDSQCNCEGKYSFNLFDYSKQEWKTITVDDFLPCYPKSKYAEMPIPKFSQPNGNEVWLLLLEKAFAKLVGGYLNLKAGYAGLAWMMLTGCMDYNRWILEKGVTPLTWRRRPIMMFHSTGQHLGFDYAAPSDSDPLYKEEDFLNYLRKCAKKNYLIGAVAVHGGAVEAVHSNGLIEGHAYAVLAVSP